MDNIITADILFINAKVYTMNEDAPWAEAVGVKNRKIIFVGNSDDSEKYIGSDTRVIDLNGKMILPGFIDAHSHPAYLAINVHAVDIKTCTTVKEYTDEIGKHAKQNPKSPIVYAINFEHSVFGSSKPEKELLDEVVPDRPVVAYSGDGHALWINSKAIELVGIDKYTTNPEGGEFVKNSKGELSGFIRGFSALSYVTDRLPEFSDEEYAMGIKEYMDNGIKSGITFCHDSDVLSDKFYNAYQILEREGLLNMRFRLAPSIYPESDISIEDQFKRVIKYHNKPKSDILQSNTVKIMYDSIFSTCTAAVEQPYIGQSDNYGELSWTDNELKTVCRLASENDIQMEFHCIGDRASRKIVEALEENYKETGKLNERCLLNHLQLVNEDIPERMAKLKAIAVVNPQWVERDGYYKKALENLGPERTGRMHPVKTFLNSHVCVATGSDVPVEHRQKPVEVYYAPLIAIQQAVTRCAIDADYNDPDNLFNPDEKVTLADMLKIFTINNAYANYAEDITGSIETGKYADLVILEKNLFDVDPGEIYKTKILMTMFEGKIVYKNI